MVNFKKLFLTKNDCYKAGKYMSKVRGLMLHSTGANNPKVSRYVGPDDGLLGKNPNNNHWNQRGIRKCVHGFIGYDKNKDVVTYRTLPWEMKAWHAGGSANNTHIGIEICESNLDDAVYFGKVYKEAVEVFAHLCKSYNLTEKNIIDHSEGHKLGIASNHGDVQHWFKRHGKTMNHFRADVKKLLSGSTPTQTPKPAVSKSKSISQLADEVLKGLHGSGSERMKSLGANYAAVQKEINRRLKK